MDSTTTTTTDPHAVAAILAAYGLFFLVFFLVAFVLQLVICWRIAVKAGYSGVLSLLMLVPLVLCHAPAFPRVLRRKRGQD